MSERARRLALWFLAALATLLLVIRGHGTFPSGTPSVASFHSSSPAIRVKVEGAPGRSGIYELPEGSSVETVMNMAVPTFPAGKREEPLLMRPLIDGEALRLSGNISQFPEISIEKMSAQEKMILGIPLDPLTMTEADWELLPGIGPALARRIVNDRQQNGDFHSLRDLERVPDIGPATVEKISPFFHRL